ncbi:MAG: RagB/SusD family nutrient uptake outer membrane protein [Phocaeicola sp.]
MKRLKYKLLTLALGASTLGITTSCSGYLDLGPIDYFGSESYWKTEAHATGYIDGIHKHLRDAAWQHVITFGELRGGHYKNGVGSDGMTLSGANIVLQNFDEVNTGVSKFGDVYGRITNLNLFIARITDATFLPEEKKNYYLGQVYGLRAFYYFDLFRIYGGVPLRLTPDVVDGVVDPTQLYMPRSTPNEVMTQIKKDIDTSLEYFGTQNSFDPFNRNNRKSYWSKAATECLKGEVYLWTAKVSTGDQTANPADLAVAKSAFTSVKDNYALSMLSSFAGVFDATNAKGNNEVIFVVRYAEGEATNSFNLYLYNNATGSSKNRFLEDGTVFGDVVATNNTASQSYEYQKEVMTMFDKEDTRRNATFVGSYDKDAESGELTLHGTHVRKNIGYINAQANRIYAGDIAFYRLPWIYLSLAEIANQEGDNGSVETYINLVRERAYGEHFNTGDYRYTAGDFTQNELAILKEKDKEFVQEGQRWWDLRRMTLTKGGKPLAFCIEGDLKGTAPLLNEATEAHKLLWPIEVGMLNNDPALTQTPGY